MSKVSNRVYIQYGGTDVNSKPTKVKRMKEMTDVNNLYKQNRDLKQRCKELSQENLLLKSEIADMRITNILLGGVQV